MKNKYIRRRIAVGLLFVGVIAFLFDATTPEQCKVPLEEMPRFCIELLYP